MGNIEVSVSNLTVRIKNKTILSHLSLEVEEGAFHGVIGPNGAGKTTLFTVLEGLQNRLRERSPFWARRPIRATWPCCAK